MTSSALQSRKRPASFAAIGSAAVVAAALGAGWSRAQAAEATAAPEAVAGAPAAAAERGASPFAERFPNLVLKTHEGKNVRFYDDLLKGKIVLINFMYASCKGR
jgi:protein SCO1/2